MLMKSVKNFSLFSWPTYFRKPKIHQKYQLLPWPTYFFDHLIRNSLVQSSYSHKLGFFGSWLTFSNIDDSISDNLFFARSMTKRRKKKRSWGKHFSAVLIFPVQKKFDKRHFFFSALRFCRTCWKDQSVFCGHESNNDSWIYQGSYTHRYYPDSSWLTFTLQPEFMSASMTTSSTWSTSSLAVPVCVFVSVLQQNQSPHSSNPPPIHDGVLHYVTDLCIETALFFNHHKCIWEFKAFFNQLNANLNIWYFFRIWFTFIVIFITSYWL